MFTEWSRNHMIWRYQHNAKHLYAMAISARIRIVNGKEHENFWYECNDDANRAAFESKLAMQRMKITEEDQLYS